jgi:hypothetical protein
MSKILARDWPCSQVVHLPFSIGEVMDISHGGEVLGLGKAIASLPPCKPLVC